MLSGPTSNITSCYNFGNVIGTDVIGGICGLFQYGGILKNSYSIGNVSTVSGKEPRYGGGAAGSGGRGTTVISYTYYLKSAYYRDIGISSEATIEGGITSKTEEEMKIKSFVDELNTSLPQEAKDLGIEWKYNAGGYPTF